MTPSRIDHLVVTAPSREAGVAWVRDVLGVAPGAGGRHARMGTHNALLGLGATTYLEVIAVDPAAPAPSRPRWFELDRLGPADVARLASWVVRSDDLRTVAAAASIGLGDIEAMARDALRWRITIPPDGTLALAGAAPGLIEWHRGPHPRARCPMPGARW